MPDKQPPVRLVQMPMRIALTRFSQISREFTDTLMVTVLHAEYLDAHQLDLLTTHFRLIQSQLETGLEVITALKAEIATNQTNQQSHGSH